MEILTELTLEGKAEYLFACDKVVVSNFVYLPVQTWSLLSQSSSPQTHRVQGKWKIYCQGLVGCAVFGLAEESRMETVL